MPPRVLVCADTYPYPPDRGDRARVKTFLEGLEAHFDVRLVLLRRLAEARERPAPDAVDVTLRPVDVAANVARHAFARVPIQFSGFDHRPGRTVVGTMGRDADLYVALGVRSALFGGSLPAALPKLLDLADSLVLNGRAQWRGARGVLRRVYGADNLLKARPLERRLVEGFDVVTVAGPADEAWIRATYPRADCRLVPTAVELPDDVAGPAPKPVATFLGDMRFPPNIDAVRFLLGEVWPLVRREHPRAALQVVGHAPERPVRRWLEAGDCATAFSVPRVEPYLDSSRVVVAPMRIGSGIKVKVLTAMASARPVVLTSMANDGIGARDGVEALVRDSAPALAGAIVSLLRDDETAARVGAAGRALVGSRFSPATVRETFAAIASEALQTSRR